MPSPTCQFHSRRGNALVGILVVIAIICVVMAMGPLRQTRTSSGEEVAQAVEPIERAAETACAINRQQMATELSGFQILASGEPPGLDQMREKLRSYRCPRKGAMVLGADGKVYCTQHAPPPIGELTSLVTLFAAKADAAAAPPAK